VARASAAAVDVHANAASGDVLIALLALAMGLRTATVRRLAVPDLTTTVLTMTMTGLAADSPLAGGSGEGSARRAAAVVAMAAGALAGALLLKSSLVLPLLAENLARIDALGLPTYLESSNRANDSRYERLGYVQVGELAAPGGEPTVGCLWRDPR